MELRIAGSMLHITEGQTAPAEGGCGLGNVALNPAFAG